MRASPRINYLSSPERVSMGDTWFEIADRSHFWIRRRFAVLRCLLTRVPIRLPHVAEVGCGHGLLQTQLEDTLHLSVDGFDLNEEALSRNRSTSGELYLYNIRDRNVQFSSHYATVFLFDVLEHIQDEHDFLEAVRYHIEPGGLLFLDVPALMTLYSAYDIAAGHFRRYNHEHLKGLAAGHHFELIEWTYWGLPMVPVLILRKLLLRRKTAAVSLRMGFDPRTRLLNAMMFALSRCERIPQQICGTSLMAVMRRVTAR
jgi:hypothetical protein